MKKAFLTLAAISFFIPLVYAANPVDLTTNEVLTILTDKKLDTENTKWGAVRLDFRADGKLYGSNSGYSDSGKWRVEDGKLCLQWYRWDYEGCGKVQRVGEKIQHLWPSGNLHFTAKP